MPSWGRFVEAHYDVMVSPAGAREAVSASIDSESDYVTVFDVEVTGDLDRKREQYREEYFV